MSGRANDNRAVVADTVNLKDILCDIEADPDRGHGDLSLNNNAAPPILSEAGSAVAEGVHPGNGFELPVPGFRSSIFYTAPEFGAANALSV